MRRLIGRLRAWLSHDRLDREFDDEIRAHLELAERDARAAGLSPEEARVAARRSFGGVEQIKEEHRDERGVPWLESLLRDTRQGLRGMRRVPALCASIVVILGVGIGANTTMFSAMQAIVLRRKVEGLACSPSASAASTSDPTRSAGTSRTTTFWCGVVRTRDEPCASATSASRTSVEPETRPTVGASPT